MAHHRGRMIGWGTTLFITGAAIGAGAGLLFAPRSGEKTRREIGRYFRNARGNAGGVVDEFTGTVRDYAETIGHKASGIIDSGRDLTKDAKDRVVEAVEDAADRLGKEKKRLMKLVG